MAGIYIHIPFCRQACNYCNFYFSTSLKHKDKLISALIQEIKQRKETWKKYTFDTIYFGGGTPSLIPESDIERILNELYKHFQINQISEITLEANPDDLNNKKIKNLKTLGINRLSIGIQSFFDDDLILLNRSHNAQQAKSVIQTAQDEGIRNISIDLIYGIPGLTDKKWINNIQQTLNFQIPHVSAYALTVEPKTALENFINTAKIPPLNDEQAARQFYILQEKLNNNHFQHYEISNFGKKGFLSKHNNSYWKNKPYLGLGPAAHSYNLDKRRWNIANLHTYIKKIPENTYYETETLSNNDKYNELIMIGLRTSDGINLNDIRKLGVQYVNKLKIETKKFIQQEYVFLDKNKLKPNPKKWFLIEGVISDLFII